MSELAASGAVTSFPASLADDRRAVTDALHALTESLPASIPAPVAEAMRYASRGSGKRLRGVLLVRSYRAAGGTGDPCVLAGAVEMLHAYSLAHDDLPCMDDDDVRRGRPATHRAHGLENAVLAGVAIVPFVAATVLRSSGASWSSAAARRIAVELMHGAGAAGMIGGQLADLEAEAAPAASIGDLERIHRLKTGALIAACCRVGGIAAGASDASVAALGAYGTDIGLAFQIVDDVLDVTSTTAELGKTVGRDVALGKSTYPALLGVEGAMSRAVALVRDGCTELERAGLLTPGLRHLADITITRTH